MVLLHRIFDDAALSRRDVVVSATNSGDLSIGARLRREAGTKRNNGYTAQWPRPSFPERRALFFRCQDNRAVWFDKRIVLDTRRSLTVPPEQLSTVVGESFL